MREAFPLDLKSAHPVAQVLSGDAPRVIRDLTEEDALEQAAQSAEHERFMREAGYRRAAVFPLVARGRTRGAISFLQLRGDARHDRNLVAVLEDLAGRAALAFDNARLYAERARGRAHAAAQPDARLAAGDPGAGARELLPPERRRQRGRRGLLRRLRQDRRTAG